MKGSTPAGFWFPEYVLTPSGVLEAFQFAGILREERERSN